jgi:hypothetical protein
MYENPANSVPQGRLNVAQDDSPGSEQLGPESPVGTTESCQGQQLGFPMIFSRPCGTIRVCKSYPGLSSWATFSRPYGTGSAFLTHAVKPAWVIARCGKAKSRALLTKRFPRAVNAGFSSKQRASKA